jgi:hypothetical protein
MSKLGRIARVATIGANALLFAASLSAAEEGRCYGTPTMNPPAVTHRPQISVKPASTARSRNRMALARMDKSSEEKHKLHRLIL